MSESGKRLVADIGEVAKADIRYCEVEYNDTRFGIEYDAEQMRTPGLLLLFQKQQATGLELEAQRVAQGKLERRATQAVAEEHISHEAALMKARRIMPMEARMVDTEVQIDLGASAKALSQLIVWIGLTAGGKLLEPTEDFFLKRVFEFHSAVFGAAMDHYNRPTNASTKDSLSASSPEGSSDSSPSSIVVSGQRDSQEATGVTTSTI
jgi:hypothetical protein